MPKLSSILRSEARLAGKLFYFTGKPCNRGHVVERYTTTAKCHECTKIYVNESYARHKDVRNKQTMIINARRRSVEYNLPFAISLQDVLDVWPKDNCCPIFHTPFTRGVKGPSPTSPSLDRIVPKLGYVKGNIAVISDRANKIKHNEIDSDALRRVADWMDTAGKNE